MLMLEQKINVNDQELIEKQTLLTKYALFQFNIPKSIPIIIF